MFFQSRTGQLTSTAPGPDLHHVILDLKCDSDVETGCNFEGLGLLLSIF